MATTFDKLPRTGRLVDEVARLAERVRASVVVVRGSQFGGGSGVVWNDQGLIVTNHHVVPGRRAEVDLGDGACLPARVTARSARLDLAALQIEGSLPATGLVPARPGDSSNLHVGQLVMAVGNPLGERNAATLGIISADGRAARLAGGADVLQIAITLRPGNSGGALADVHGQVVGIPNLVVGGNLALAVPTHVVERFLIGEEGGRAHLGLYGQWVELPPVLAERSGLAIQAGLLVVAVEPESPAERAGLTIGDTVVGVAEPGIDGAVGPVELLARLHVLPPPHRVRLAVVRGGRLHWFDLANKS